MGRRIGGSEYSGIPAQSPAVSGNCIATPSDFKLPAFSL
jgi:hypothetical protein